jgi:site-specific DNA-cytosine methylase/integrase
MNGVAAGSWTDGVYAIVKTEDWEQLLRDILTDDLMSEGVDEGTVIVAIWEFLCIIMIATYCAARWTDKVVVYVSDNQLVMHWITNLRARCKIGNYFCGLLTLLQARFRFEMYCVYINTKNNMWDEPSRVFDSDDIREGPGLDELDAYMNKVFPGLVPVDVDEALMHYLRPGGVKNGYELFGFPDPVARSLAAARCAPVASSLDGLTFVGLYSGIMALERELTALGGCVRAVGEWSAASRAVARLDLGPVEYFEDVLSGDHTRVDPAGVEGAVITASCVDYSTAGSCSGLDGSRGWQIVDSPRVLLHFRDLLVSLVENVFGWITANGGQSFAFYTTAMNRLRHTVWEPQRLNSRHLGMAIQSERAFVFTNRRELDSSLGPPRRLDEIRRPGVPLRRKLAPVAEVLQRRSECEVHLVEGSWRPAVVQNREFGPMRIGSATFDGRKANGEWRPGAKVRTENSKQTWRVLAVFGDGRIQIRSGMNKHVVKPDTIIAEEKFAVQVYSVDGQAFRVTASDVAEPPLYQSKACYWESRCSPGFYRTLLAKEGWGAMGKDVQQLRLWEQRAAEEAADSMLPKTVPPFTSKHIWSLTGNSIAQAMAALGSGELYARWRRAKEVLVSGSAVLETELPTNETELYDEVAVRWRARTMAGELITARVPDRHGINDSYLNVALRAIDDSAGAIGLDEQERALDYLRSFSVSRSGSEGLGGGRSAMAPGEEPVGAVRARPVRSRTAPVTLQMPPTMRGGDRNWRERMSVEDVDFDGDGESAVASPAVEVAKVEVKPSSCKTGRSGRAATPRSRARRPVRRAPARAPRSARPVRRACRVSPKPAPVKAAPAAAGGAKSKKAATWQRKKDAGVVTSVPSAHAASRCIASNARHVTSTVDPAPAAVRVARKVSGPARPPVRKQKRKMGLAIASLEVDDMFARGDWAEIERFATCRLPMFSVAWSTLKGYESCWKHWCAFQYHARLPIFLDVETAAKRKRSSTWLLSFVALLAFGAKYKASTIKKCLMAIRFFHLAHDLDNPIAKCPRVWQGYHAVKRQQGPTVRKHPATPEMLDALDTEQKKLGLVGVIKRAGRYIGVFLGCRCSEYLGPDIDWDKIIQTSDVRPMMGHQYCEWSDEFDGLMVTFRGSKTDQYNEGCKRYVGVTGNSRCAVRAFREWYTLQPSHFERSDVVPMFTMPDGRVLGRTEMQNDLRHAALLAGLSDENIGTHSLRVSCATWLYQAGYDLEYIKRHGRWASNVVHVYLWEGSGFHAMCKKMSECKFVLHTNV